MSNDSDSKEFIHFDEIEANIVYAALTRFVKNGSWDLSDESEWQHLLMVKTLEARVRRWIDGAD